MARKKCKHCDSIQLYTRDDGVKVCRKCGKTDKEKENG